VHYFHSLTHSLTHPLTHSPNVFTCYTDAKPQYMAKIDNNLDMFREIESIIENDITNGMQAKVDVTT
jgi:hypothetical protein